MNRKAIQARNFWSAVSAAVSISIMFISGLCTGVIATMFYKDSTPASTETVTDTVTRTKTLGPTPPTQSPTSASPTRTSSKPAPQPTKSSGS